MLRFRVGAAYPLFALDDRHDVAFAILEPRGFRPAAGDDAFLVHAGQVVALEGDAARFELGVAYTDDEEKAIEERKKYWAGTFVPALFTEKIYTPEMSEKNGKVVGSDAVRKASCISGDPAEHVKYARKYIDLGFDHLIFHSAGPDQGAFIESYGRDVLPKLRRK